MGHYPLNTKFLKNFTFNPKIQKLNKGFLGNNLGILKKFHFLKIPDALRYNFLNYSYLLKTFFQNVYFKS